MPENELLGNALMTPLGIMGQPNVFRIGPTGRDTEKPFAPDGTAKAAKASKNASRGR
jgi:hypothetical protein